MIRISRNSLLYEIHDLIEKIAINDCIQNNFVKIINFRERNTNTRPTFDAYEECYSKNFKKYMDEFLILHKKKDNSKFFK